MRWQEQLIRQITQDQAVQISINGQIFTVTTQKDQVVFTNPFRESEQFPTVEAVIHRLESNLENPTIVVLQ
ncbi:MAG: hypothetical protein JWN30_2459 [Bacilli bacterium]|nr:hypothetical protein [Bacilli bacterium]